MANPTAQWKGDNIGEIEMLLMFHDATAVKDGDRCYIMAEGLSITLNLGDSLIREGDQLGVIRPAIDAPDPEITWTGQNVEPMARFLAGYKIRVELRGSTLSIHDLQGREPPAVLTPGDKLIERGGKVVVSKAGKGHRLQ
jgi:hypothetical protein